MKIFIRADGGKGIGLGHIMRTLVLADEFLKRNNEVIYLCKEGIKYNVGSEKIINQGFSVIFIKGKNVVKEIIEIQKIHKADMLITDSYDVNENYFNKLKLYFKLSGYIDDLNKCKMKVDYLINQNINAKTLNYSINVMPCTKLLLGTEYCLLREEFRKKYIEKDSSKINDDILLTLGGMDDNYNTLKILNIIKHLKKNIHVVIGKAFRKELIEMIYDMNKKYHNIIPYEDANMSLLMSKCDIAISACGSTLYELCAMEVPTIGIILAENQKSVGEVMKKEGILFEVFYIDDVDNLSFEEKVKNFILDMQARKKIIVNQRNLVNKNGVERLVDEIMNLF